MATLFVLWAAAVLALSRGLAAHREHKVHNIVLYPDKYSWCNITPIKQVVAHPDCTSVEIDNNVCVGTCFSYSIPVTLPSAPGEIIKPYCDSCQPSAVVWQNFTLTCQEKTMEKMVQIIQNCSCSTCSAGKDILDSMLQYPSLPESDTRSRNTDGRTSLGWMAESNEERSPDSENQDSTENERVLVLIKKNTDNEEDEEGDRQDSITESEDKYMHTDNFEKGTIKNLLQEAEMAEYYTEEKLNTLCKYYKLKENSKSADTFKHDILNVQHKKAYTKEENSEHHHNAGQGTRHHHHSHHAGAHHPPQQLHKTDGQMDPTLEVSADQLKPATGGEDLSYIPSSERDSDNTAKGE